MEIAEISKYRLFVERLFKGSLTPNRFAELRKIDQLGKAHQKFYSNIDEFLRAALEQDEGWNHYFGIHPRDRRRGTSEEITCVTCIWADLDWKDFTGGREECSSTIQQFLLQPTVVVESGHGVHLYWLLKELETLEDPEQFRAIVKGVQTVIRSDRVNDLPRVLRVPGTLNYKDPENPIPCKIISADYDTEYTLWDFETFVQKEDEKVVFGSRSEGDGIIEQGSRNQSLTSVAGSMRHIGLGEAEILAAIRETNAVRCKPPLDEQELHKIAQSVTRYAPGNKTAGESPSTQSWRLWDLGNFREWPAPPVEWLVESLIPKGGIGFLSAAPKDRKSLLTLDLSIHLSQSISSGRKWMGKFSCTTAKVLYISREDPLSRLKDRLIDISEGYGLEKPPTGHVYFLVRERFNLMDSAHQQWVTEQIKEYDIDLLVLDVLNRMIPGVDESSAKSMAEVIDVLEILNRDLDLTILILDHIRKPQAGSRFRRDSQRPNPFDLKGSVAKYGAADFLLCLSHTRRDDELQMYCENKDTDKRPYFLIEVSPRGSGEPKFSWVQEIAKIASDRKSVGAANREKVLAALSTIGKSPREIHNDTELAESTVRSHLKALSEEGKATVEGKTSARKWSRVFEEGKKEA